MAPVNFAVLPFVRVDGAMKVGALTVWPSTAVQWKTRLGVAPPKLLELYRDRLGRTLQEHLSIMSPSPGQPVSFGQYQDAAVVLSTAEWLRGVFGPASDAWIFEPWQVEEGDDHHSRFGKFSMNMTDADNDRLYPDPYTSLARASRYSYGDILQRLDPLLTSGQNDARQRLTALWHLYLARRNAPYFGSPFEDLEAVWSAFEAWYQLPRHAGYADKSRVATFIRAWVPRTVSRRLCGKVLERVSRATLVSEGVLQDLRPILDARTTGELRSLIQELYDLRNTQSHGGAPPPERLKREQQDAHVLGLALSVWHILLEHTFFGDELLTGSHLQRRLRDTFLERALHDALLAAFKDRTRLDWCDDAGKPGDPAHVVAQKDLLYEVTEMNVIPRRYRRLPPARRACHTALLVLSAWVKSIDARGGTGSAARVVASFRAEADMVWKGKTGDERDRELVRLILKHKLHDRESFESASFAEIGDLGGIDLPTWARIVVRLRELSVGHELVG